MSYICFGTSARFLLDLFEVAENKMSEPDHTHLYGSNDVAQLLNLRCVLPNHVLALFGEFLFYWSR